VSSLPYSYVEWAMGQWQGHVKEDSCSMCKIGDLAAKV